ncbi:MAG: FIST C-terminal domain-containing protein [Candidatus Omnitrophica bacterium]|nr:FIST C-terminal domain-containing protein [Candidatus Omnitrophota bacterium]
MIHAASGYSEIRSWEKAAVEASKLALEKAGLSRASTVFLFATSSHRKQLDKILPRIKKITGAEHLIGSSGWGILTEELEIERRPGLAVLVVDGPELEISSLALENLQENNFMAGAAAGNWLKTLDLPPEAVVTFADPFSFQSPHFFDGLEINYGYIPLIGGCAGEDGREGKTYQWAGTQNLYDAVSLVSLGGALRHATGLARSCQPFGETFQVTRSEGNLIYEMDGRPAYDILLESLSLIEFSSSSPPVKGDDILQQVFLGLPVKSFQTDFAQSPFMIRHILGVNAKKGLFSCVSPVEEGEFVTFTVRNPEFARQDMESMLSELQTRIRPEEARFGIYINCCARGEALYGQGNHDVSKIRSFFPKLPVIGIFSYGELAPIDHVNHLHHYSGALSLFAEK